MAKANLKMKVSVEKVIHDSIRETLQMLVDDHGIMVNNVYVGWLDLSQADKPRHVVNRLTIETETSLSFDEPKKHEQL